MRFSDYFAALDGREVVDELRGLAGASTPAERLALCRRQAGKFASLVQLAETLELDAAMVASFVGGVLEQTRETLTCDESVLFMPYFTPESRDEIAAGLTAFRSTLMESYTRAAYEAQKSLVAEHGEKALMDREARTVALLKKLLPGINRLRTAVLERGNPAITAHVLQAFDYEHLAACSRQRFALVTLGPAVDLLAATIEDVSNADMAEAIGVLLRAMPPARLGKIVMRGVALAESIVAFLETPEADTARELPPVIDAAMTRFGKDLLAVHRAARKAVFAAHLPIVERFDEVVAMTFANSRTFYALKRPSTRRAARPRGVKPV
jgi:hypothetical protein